MDGLLPRQSAGRHLPGAFRLPVRSAASAVLAAGILLTIPPTVTLPASPPSHGVRRTEWDVLRQVNQLRANHGLASLRMTGDVRAVARDRSRSMKDLDYFGHVSPSGQTAGDLLRGRGVRYRWWGEVIGRTPHCGPAPCSRRMVAWWKGSPSHRRFILSRQYRYAGVGIAMDGRLTLWTVVFVD